MYFVLKLVRRIDKYFCFSIDIIQLKTIEVLIFQ